MAMYFIESLKDNPQCTIRAGYRNATCSNGYVELDDELDKPIIDSYKAVLYVEEKKVTKKLKEVGE